MKKPGIRVEVAFRRLTPADALRLVRRTQPRSMQNGAENNILNSMIQIRSSFRIVYWKPIKFQFYEKY